MAVPELTYGCKNKDLNGTDRRKNETAEVEFLRQVSGYALCDCVNNNTK
jgi:hypothetical protein